MDDRFIANIVNTVRDIAINFHATEQLRARIAHVLVPQLKRIAEVEAQLATARREAAEAQALVKRYRIACTEHMFGADSPIIKAIDDEVGEIGFHALADAIEQARLKEREACAKVCEEHPDGMSMLGGAFVVCAAAIRARSEK